MSNNNINNLNSNRKYLTSTGILLKTLNEESSNFQLGPSSSSYSHLSNYNNKNMNSMQHHTSSLQPSSSIPSSSGFYLNTRQQQQQQQPSGILSNQFFNQPTLFQQQQQQQNSLPVAAAAAAAAQLISQFAAVQKNNNSNQIHQSFSMPDIMMLPGATSQQRWQQSSSKSKNSSSFHNSKNNKINHHKKSSVSSLSNSSSTSTVTELPETFGLPSNNRLNKKFGSSSTSSSSTEISIKNSATEILIDDTVQNSPDVVEMSKSESNVADLEIIERDCAPQATSASTAHKSLSLSVSASDDAFKAYLAKNYNNSGQIAIASKPQCNFISNLTCINQILDECDYYNKLRRRKPFANVKIKLSDEDEDDDDEEEANDDKESVTKKFKSKQVIIIDDTNEEMHKPWITPDLIKLIKHRNLLQSKINENSKLKLASESEKDDTIGKVLSGADAELMKKFRNLRNKVTKLVKKARKEYLAKYIQESKENKQIENNKQSITSNGVDINLISSLAKQTPPPPPPLQTTTVSTKEETEISKNLKQLSPGISAVASITSQLKSSANSGGETSTFLQNQSNLMVNLYTNYYNQYMQQYQQQQQQAQQLAAETTAAAEAAKKKLKKGIETGVDESNQAASGEATGLEVLQKQAAFYAQQQHAIQTQLETSLTQSAQQLIQEITMMAASKINQAPVAPVVPSAIVLNQFNHQQQHHLHQHHHVSSVTGGASGGSVNNPSQQSGVPNFMPSGRQFMQQHHHTPPGIIGVSQPSLLQTSSIPVGVMPVVQSAPVPPPQQQQQPPPQQQYNMHYNYNMIVS